ncbi:hypothetical protein C3489_14745, partial [Streptomyces sp. Ru71]
MSTEARRGSRPHPESPRPDGPAPDPASASATDAPSGSASGLLPHSASGSAAPRFPSLRPAGGDTGAPPPASARYPDAPPPPPASARFPDSPPTVGRGTVDRGAQAPVPAETATETTARLRPVPAAAEPMPDVAPSTRSGSLTGAVPVASGAARLGDTGASAVYRGD